MFTTRPWSSIAVFLCALLLQDCQSNSVRTIAEEEPAAGLSSSSASAVRQRASSEHPAMWSLISLSASHAAYVSSFSPSSIPTDKEDRSAAPYSRALIPSAPSTRATVGNPLVAPYHLPAAVEPKASYAAPLGNTPGVLSSVLTTASGECVRFIQIDGQWRAAMQAGYGVATLQRTLPVVGKADVGDFLLWLQSQDQWTSRARIHILGMPQAPYGPCVYLGRAGLLGGMPASPGQEVGQGSRMAPLTPFGAKEWRHYYGEVGEEPALPDDIDAILQSRCPFWSEKQVKDTHLLVLIPAEVDGESFTLDRLGELIECPKNSGHRAQYRYYDDATKAQIGAAFPATSYWLLMTRDILPASRNETYANQIKLVTAHANRTGLPYEPPKALEVATAILMHHVRDGERLYSDHPVTYTHCQELIFSPSGGECSVVVGGFESSGLNVYHNFYDYYYNGVAGCRKF
jgi:hypothetical protein